MSVSPVFLGSLMSPACLPAAPAEGGKKKDKKKGQGGPAAGVGLGKGTAILRGFLEAVAAGAVGAAGAAGGSDGQLEAR